MQQVLNGGCPYCLHSEVLGSSKAKESGFWPVATLTARDVSSVAAGQGAWAYVFDAIFQKLVVATAALC